MFKYYVTDYDTAVLNNYNCVQNPTEDGKASWPDGFDPTQLVQYPDCFFNLGQYDK